MVNPWLFFVADNLIMLRTLVHFSVHHIYPLCCHSLYSPLLSTRGLRTLVISSRSSHPLLSTSTASNANRSLSATVPEESAARVQWNSAKSTVAEEFLSKRKNSLGER